jgi:bis(5'-nucleosidyl)-tetraphosphatase
MEHSYGIIPLQRWENEWQVFLVHRTKSGGFWEFPKGHLDEGETSLAAAERELREETGLSIATLLEFNPLTEYYEYEWHGKTIPKEVHYYLAIVEGEVALQPNEVDEGKWVPLRDAEIHVTHDSTRSLCQKAIKLMQGSN